MNESIDTSESMAQPLPDGAVPQPQDSKPATVEGLRAAFEAAMRKRFPDWGFASDGCGGYHAHYTEAAWIAWQDAYATRLAGQAAMVQEPVAWPKADFDYLRRQMQLHWEKDWKDENKARALHAVEIDEFRRQFVRKMDALCTPPALPLPEPTWQRVQKIAEDFVPMGDQSAQLALDEMRAALVGLVDELKAATPSPTAQATKE